MTDYKGEIDHIEHSSSHDGQHNKRLFSTVTLTPEQFESLYLQPRDPRVVEGLARRVGNPTPL